jgi:hypothetical protein
MMKDFKKPAYLAFLFFFFSTVLFVNFCHTEKTLAEDDNCPACSFMALALENGQIPHSLLPPLDLLEILQICNIFEHKKPFLFDSISRAPPDLN